MEHKEIIEELTEENSRQVATEQLENNQVETIAVNEFGKVDEISLDYNEYRNNLTAIYKITNKKNSIISEYLIDGDTCKHKLTIKHAPGIEETPAIKTFEYNENFIESFLVSMVEDYAKYNNVFKSTIEMLDDGKANFIARTEENDSLIIKGITDEYANMFKDMLTKNDNQTDIVDKTTFNNKGISNYLVIILTIVTIGIALAGMVVFSTIYYK